MDPAVLAQVLRPLQHVFQPDQHPELLVGLSVSDDAAVYKITDEIAVIQTLDFFTPVVDDPYDYGAIAAANAMSDIYAMGGRVTLALNICAFPPDLPQTMISEILRGGAEKVAEAGGVLVGGHTIDDKEPKYGLSVMGLVHPNRIFTKSNAQPGDLLILTKPLGVGMITTALKGQVADSAHVAAAVQSMKRLNRQAADVLRQIEVHACTDITGFAVLGHGVEMAAKSGVRLQFEFEKLPFLKGAEEYAEEFLFPGGACKNQRCYEEQVSFDPTLSEEQQLLLFTPETSGGLLIAIAPGELPRLERLFGETGQFYKVIGHVEHGSGVHVTNP